MENMQNTDKSETEQFKNRQLQRIFQEIDDQITILTATAKFNHTTRKTDQNTLKLTLAYIQDTTKIVQLLKERINLLIETTTNVENTKIQG
jgi:hypothetical protein